MQRYGIVRGFAVTANDDGTIPLSAAIVAQQDKADVQGSVLAALVAQANAAPELLDALREADKWIQAEGENGDAVPDDLCTPGYRKARALIRAAIAKAEVA